MVEVDINGRGNEMLSTRLESNRETYSRVHA